MTEFCSERNINSIQPTVNGFISFFSLLYHQGQGYRSICNAISALNNIIYLPEFSDISQHPLIRRFIKGIFNLRPPQPRYAEIWDVSIVFRFIDEWGYNEHLSLKQLTIKTATILLLLSRERINTLSSFDIENMIIDEHKCVFIPTKLLKHSRPCYVNKPVKFYVHEENPNICPVQTIKHYLDKRSNNAAHETTTFFITHGKPPFKTAHEDTISRWAKEVKPEGGTDVSKYNTHSCRSAASTGELFKGVHIADILNQGNWSNLKTFKKYYFKNIENLNEPIDFSKKLLENINK